MLLNGGFNVKVAQSIRKVFRQVLANCDNFATGRSRIFIIMRHQKNRQSMCPGPVENEAAEAVAQPGIELPERFVEQQRLGLRQQHAQECHAGPLSTGKCCRITGFEAFEAGLRKGRGDALAPHAPVEARGQPESQIAGNRQVRKQQIVLEQDADMAALGRQGPDLDAGQANPALPPEGRVEGAAKIGEQARLAASGGTHQGGDLPRRDREVEGSEQQLAAEPEPDAGEDQASTVGAGHRPGHRPSPRRPPRTTAGRSMAKAKPASGSAAWRNPKTPARRRSPPVPSATASVVSVAKRPAPANTVGR
jgi:hypothetical protein